MKKALIIIAAIAILGVLAAYVNPLGPEGHKSLASITKGLGSSPTPKSTTPVMTNTPASSTNTSSSTTASGYKDGTFHGSDISTPYGDVQISVAISGGKITGVTFDQLNPQDGHSQTIESDAAPRLKQQTLSAQSANIDGVSGASYTSEAYVQSLQSALDQAKA